MKPVIVIAVLVAALIAIHVSPIGGTDVAKTMGAIIFLLLIPLCYFLPTIIAITRGHPNSAPIGIINFFFGWSFLGWVLALVWSATAIRPRCPLTTTGVR
jgi:hypothetical protein